LTNPKGGSQGKKKAVLNVTAHQQIDASMWAAAVEGQPLAIFVPSAPIFLQLKGIGDWFCENLQDMVK
jgi:hypothetical protein